MLVLGRIAELDFTNTIAFRDQWSWPFDDLFQDATSRKKTLAFKLNVDDNEHSVERIFMRGLDTR